MRPRKPRFLDGQQLADNLYPDPRKRPGYYSYIRPDGSRKTFQAASVVEANRLAEEANALRGTDLPVERKRPARETLAFHVPKYVAYMEGVNPELRAKRSWDNRRYALNQFAEQFIYLSDITHERIYTWWDDLTYHQQKLRMAEFRRFFNWLMRKGLTPKLDFNPFTKSDDVPRLLFRDKPKKARKPVTDETYPKIVEAALELDYEALVLAMGLSRYTMMREGDICRLRLDRDVAGNKLKAVVSKSEAQRGSARAVRLEWDLDQHPVLRALVNRARELSLKNKRCPFLISHTPRRRAWNEKKEHLYQVTPDRLSRMFGEAMRHAGVEGTAFHEVRGYAITLYKRAGYTEEQIRGIAGHEHIHTTMGYMDAESLPHVSVGLKLAE